MARKTKSRPGNPDAQKNSASDIEAGSPPDNRVSARGQHSASNSERVAVPSRRLKFVLLGITAVHLLALALSFLSVTAPSDSHSALESLFSPYLRAAHFSASEQPLYLTAGGTEDQPLRLQTTDVDPQKDLSIFFASIDDERWTTLDPSGVPGGMSNDFYHRWLSDAALLSLSENPGPVAELLAPSIPSDGSVKAVRIIQLPTELTTSADDSRPAPYMAHVTSTNGSVSLVQAVELRLATLARSEVMGDE